MQSSWARAMHPGSKRASTHNLLTASLHPSTVPVNPPPACSAPLPTAPSRAAAAAAPASAAATSAATAAAAAVVAGEHMAHGWGLLMLHAGNMAN